MKFYTFSMTPGGQPNRFVLELNYNALQSRVRELETERDAWKSAAQEAGLRTYDGLAQENARLTAENAHMRSNIAIYESGAGITRMKRVVDAALAIDKQAQFCWEFCPDDLSDAFCNALREVDGEKKCGLCTDTKPCNFEACPDDK